MGIGSPTKLNKVFVMFECQCVDEPDIIYGKNLDYRFFCIFKWTSDDHFM